ncbi:7553_t:CDS:2 [Scutellospora calospora]|uniref:7553_t:CDS:1 n=1 Tax=Scutellospora calospora TaxID=85575 RepID=A0ACA9KB96_9GLOM|nr:7553_t:CDS:2 [Scutellospora calospora]
MAFNNRNSRLRFKRNIRRNRQFSIRPINNNGTSRSVIPHVNALQIRPPSASITMEEEMVHEGFAFNLQYQSTQGSNEISTFLNINILQNLSYSS